MMPPEPTIAAFLKAIENQPKLFDTASLQDLLHIEEVIEQLEYEDDEEKVELVADAIIDFSDSNHQIGNALKNMLESGEPVQGYRQLISDEEIVQNAIPLLQDAIKDLLHAREKIIIAFLETIKSQPLLFEGHALQDLSELEEVIDGLEYAEDWEKVELVADAIMDFCHSNHQNGNTLKNLVESRKKKQGYSSFISDKEMVQNTIPLLQDAINNLLDARDKDQPGLKSVFSVEEQ